MSRLKIINLSDTPSLASVYMKELRDVTIQHDPMRFRRNLERLGEILAYEISKTLSYEEKTIDTPLEKTVALDLKEKVVLATILRAGLPFHQGFLNYFDRAENAFVSAYRKYKEKGDNFEVLIEYMASPSVEGKTLLLVDPMLATGTSMELGYRAMLHNGEPAKIHVVSAIASRQAIDYIDKVFPASKTTVWTAAIDPGINSHSYIVPGLGDAGDLAFGEKI